MLLIFLSLFIKAQEPIRVAVIDSGFTDETYNQINHCDNKKDLVFFESRVLSYRNITHGSSIVNLISKYAKNRPHCFILVIGFGKKISTTVKAIEYAIERKADIIAFSGGGYKFFQEEFDAIKKFNKPFFASVGNDSLNLNIKCVFYPACYNLPNIKSVSNNESYSNIYYKSIVSDIDGDSDINVSFNLRGTSQSTAIEAGKYVNGK